MSLRSSRASMAALLLLALGACGDDEDEGAGADAGVDGDAGVEEPDAGGGGALCAELLAPAGTIDSYPGELDGSTVGGGADLANPEGVCGEEAGDWYEQIGEDVVIELADLVPGTPYAVRVTSEEDLGVYVVSGCQPASAGPVAGQCLGFADLTAVGEQLGFVAPESGVAWAVIDSANLPQAPTAGDFTLEVSVLECATSFHCADADEPVCEDSTCAAGYGECTGDDAADDGPGGDDGPAAATPIATPTVDVPTVIEAAACSLPDPEDDWFRLEITEADAYGMQLARGSEADFDLIVLDEAGSVVELGITDGFFDEELLVDLAPGTYYLRVYLYNPALQAAAEPYTLTVLRAECASPYDCTNPDEPACSSLGACVAGPDECIDDDKGDAGGGDDGPAGARAIGGAVNVERRLRGRICNVPLAESDWYSFTVADGEGMDLALNWTPAADLDIEVFDATGRYVGLSYWVNPEVVSLTYLPAGTYHVRVTLFDPQQAATVPYRITATRRAAQICASAADCAADLTRQVFRGDCTDGGACAFLDTTGGAAGTPCDDPTNCASGICSHLPFEADAHESVCTAACVTDADCGAVGAGFTCTTGFQTNLCVPPCTSNVECGALYLSPDLDPGLPWDYMTCTPATGVCSFP